MTTAPQAIAIGARRALGLGETLARDIPADRFARLTNNESGRVDANHPAFVLGHLAIYPVRLGALAGVDLPEAQVPEQYPDLFAAGVACHDDPESTIYPTKDEIVENFLRAHNSILTSLESWPDEVLTRQTPEERWQKSFPTIGTAACFLMLGHTMFHLGQLSTWRRCEGLSSAM